MTSEPKKANAAAGRVLNAFLLAACISFPTSCGYFDLLNPYAPPAPPPPVTWQTHLGGVKDDVAYSVRQTADGGYILCGSTCSFGAGEKDVYLVKTDSEGEPEWSMTFGGTAADEGRCVLQLPPPDGGYVLVGTTSSFGAGAEDVYLLKTNALGEEEWHKTFGGSGDEEGYCVQRTSDDGYIIAGNTCPALSVVDVLLIRTDGEGKELWSKTFGGVFQDGGRCVRQTAEGGYVVAGFGEYQTLPPYVNENAYLLKTDADGSEQWSECFGGDWLDSGTGLEPTADGGYILCGYTVSFGEGEINAMLVKTDAAGQAQWLRAYGGDNWDQAEAVLQTPDGGYALAGMSRSFTSYGQVYLVKTDGDGGQQWSATFGGGGDEWAHAVQQTADGGFILAGKTTSFGAGDQDVYLVYYKP